MLLALRKLGAVMGVRQLDPVVMAPKCHVVRSERAMKAYGAKNRGVTATATSVSVRSSVSGSMDGQVSDVMWR